MLHEGLAGVREKLGEENFRCPDNISVSSSYANALSDVVLKLIQEPFAPASSYVTVTRQKYEEDIIVDVQLHGKLRGLGNLVEALKPLSKELNRFDQMLFFAHSQHGYQYLIRNKR